MKFHLFRTSVLSVPLERDEERVKDTILGYARKGIEESFGLSFNKRKDGLTIEISTIEELMKFRTIVGDDLVVGKDWIEIYDDSREL